MQKIIFFSLVHWCQNLKNFRELCKFWYLLQPTSLKFFHIVISLLLTNQELWGGKEIVQYFSFHEIFSLTLNAKINTHCWRFCFGIIWGWKFPKLTFVLPKLILKYKLVNFALEAKPVKCTTTSCVEIAAYYNVLFCGFFVMFWLLRKEFTLNWTFSGGNFKTQSAILGFFLGGVGVSHTSSLKVDWLSCCLPGAFSPACFFKKNLPSQEFAFRRSL